MKQEKMSLTPREDKHKKQLNSGHAWNVCIQISKKETLSSISDITWANKDLKTKKILNVDYTLLRMEKYVKEIAEKLDTQDENNQKEFQKIIQYYQYTAKKMLTEKKYDNYIFLITQLTDSLSKKNISSKLTIPVEDIQRTYYFLAEENQLDMKDINDCWKIFKNTKNKLRIYPILEHYISNINLTEKSVTAKIQTKSNDLQIEIFKFIKKKPKFKEVIQSNPELRKLYRKIFPNELTEFSPVLEQTDTLELVNLVKDDEYLRSRFLHILANVENKPLPQKQTIIGRFMFLIKNELKKQNPKLYKKTKILSDYQLIENYQKIYKQLKNNNPQKLDLIMNKNNIDYSLSRYYQTYKEEKSLTILEDYLSNIDDITQITDQITPLIQNIGEKHPEVFYLNQILKNNSNLQKLTLWLQEEKKSLEEIRKKIRNNMPENELPPVF